MVKNQFPFPSKLHLLKDHDSQQKAEKQYAPFPDLPLKNHKFRNIN